MLQHIAEELLPDYTLVKTKDNWEWDMLKHNVCREKSAIFSGCNSHPVTGRSNR